MRILLRTEREDVEVDVAQAHKEAEVRQTTFVLGQAESSRCVLQKCGA
jgi:hypothetical protein